MLPGIGCTMRSIGAPGTAIRLEQNGFADSPWRGAHGSRIGNPEQRIGRAQGRGQKQNAARQSQPRAARRRTASCPECGRCAQTAGRDWRPSPGQAACSHSAIERERPWHIPAGCPSVKPRSRRSRARVRRGCACSATRWRGDRKAASRSGSAEDSTRKSRRRIWASSCAITARSCASDRPVSGEDRQQHDGTKPADHCRRLNPAAFQIANGAVQVRVGAAAPGIFRVCEGLGAPKCTAALMFQKQKAAGQAQAEERDAAKPCAHQPGQDARWQKNLRRRECNAVEENASENSRGECRAVVHRLWRFAKRHRRGRLADLPLPGRQKIARRDLAEAGHGPARRASSKR